MLAIDTVNKLRDHVISTVVHSYFRIMIMIQSIVRITTHTQCLKLFIHITEKITTVTHKYLKRMLLFAESFTKHNCALNY